MILKIVINASISVKLVVLINQIANHVMGKYKNNIIILILISNFLLKIIYQTNIILDLTEDLSLIVNALMVILILVQKIVHNVNISVLLALIMQMNVQYVLGIIYIFKID